MENKEYIFKSDDLNFRSNTDVQKKIDVSFLKINTHPFFHQNYLDYLARCYNSHHGIIIKPDYIWYTILSEISVIVKDTPEKYRKLFTSSDDKVDIKIPVGHPDLIDIGVLFNEVMKLIPSSIDSKYIIPNFSTSEYNDVAAFTVSFLDTVSPYYNYFTYMCGFNKMKVLGTKNDYMKINSTLDLWLNVLGDNSLQKYISKCKYRIDDLLLNFENEEWWKNIFYSKRCGSGSQQTVHGWFVQLFDKTPSLQMVCNYNTHTARIEYTNLSTNTKYEMMYGLFNSHENDGYMVPNFIFYVNKL